IHADLTFPEQTFLPFASLGPELAERTVTLTSASKAFNIAGLRCAFAHFGSAELQARFNACAPPHVRGGVGILGQHCTLAAWRSGDPWLDEVKRTLDANRRFLVRELRRAAPQLGVQLPEATYLAWLDCERLALPVSPARHFLEHARVALSDGAHFGPGFERCVRLNFGTSPGILAQILQRLLAAVV
ncbi:MAG TPA: aminotransferase class I/II-fold pyridoxal phosphate-dependent enzyme, partial [Polyangiaceae bacterium]|nr:aminotransferase class I/II-fold pyridoxal phosphate-dependent enzyme [Polyangiaceae bacterium]